MARNADNTDSKTVSFRLDVDLLASLEARAAQHQLSRGKLARMMVASVLQDEKHLQHAEDLARLQSDLADLRSDITSLRADIATTLEIALINIANKDVTTVRAFVGENLRTRR